MDSNKTKIMNVYIFKTDEVLRKYDNVWTIDALREILYLSYRLAQLSDRFGITFSDEEFSIIFKRDHLPMDEYLKSTGMIM